jgi:hypothetical protein
MPLIPIYPNPSDSPLASDARGGESDFHLSPKEKRDAKDIGVDNHNRYGFKRY